MFFCHILLCGSPCNGDAVLLAVILNSSLADFDGESFVAI